MDDKQQIKGLLKRVLGIVTEQRNILAKIKTTSPLSTTALIEAGGQLTWLEKKIHQVAKLEDIEL